MCFWLDIAERAVLAYDAAFMPAARVRPHDQGCIQSLVGADHSTSWSPIVELNPKGEQRSGSGLF